MYGHLDPQRSPPRDFNSIVQICSANVQRISGNTAQIRNMVSQLGTKQDNSQLLENLQQIQHSTNQIAKDTNKLLKELGSLPLPLSSSEQRQQKLQKERLMNDFSSALNNFQTIQRKVSEKEKETVARARAGSRLSEDQRHKDEQLVSFDNNEDWNQMQSQEEAITEEDLELIKERESAIQKLEADILDVNQIFKDLAVMIHDQGDMIGPFLTPKYLGSTTSQTLSTLEELPQEECSDASILSPSPGTAEPIVSPDLHQVPDSTEEPAAALSAILRSQLLLWFTMNLSMGEHQHR